jgi:hypothetical protein
MSAILEEAARLDAQRARDLDLTDRADRANDLELARLVDDFGAFVDSYAKDAAEEKLCRDVHSFSEFICRAAICAEREASAYFAFISTEDLVGQILLSPMASDKQLAEAAREIRARYLKDVLENGGEE